MVSWAWLLLPLLFSAPWIAGIVWVLLRVPRGMWDEPFASRADLSRRHLWTS